MKCLDKSKTNQRLEQEQIKLKNLSLNSVVGKCEVLQNGSYRKKQSGNRPKQ